MPIEVRCPNPACDRVHRVKDKYAGMRGRCPNCGSWMLIPRNGGVPSAVYPHAETLASAALSGGWPEEANQGGRRTAEEAAPAGRKGKRPGPQEAVPSAKKARRVEPDEVRPETPEREEEAPKPARHFGVFAMLLLFLASLALGAVAAIPYVEQPSIQVTGALTQTALEKLPLGVRADATPYLNVLPPVAAGLTFLSFLIALVRRKFGALSLIPAYLALPLAWAMAVVAGFIFHDHLDKLLPKLEKQAQQIKEERKAPGELTVSWGQSLFVGAGGAVGGFLLLSFAIFLMHRRWVSRFLFFCLFLLLLAGGGAVIFAEELGLEPLLPIVV